MNKDLLFVLNQSDEYIKAKFVHDDDEQIYFLSMNEDILFDNLEEFKNSNINFYKENELELSLLIECIETDEVLIEKIKNNKGNKLMFRYDSEKFNRYLEQEM